MRKLVIAIAAAFVVSSCQSEPSLERFMVDHAEAKNFVHMDLTSDMIASQVPNLSSEEQALMKSFKKLNILAYRATDSTDTQLKAKWDEVRQLVQSQPQYEELMRMGSGSQGAALYVVGDENNVKEFVLLGNGGSAVGFAVVRLLGDNMKMENAMTLMSVIGRLQGEGSLPQLKEYF